ncbi:hypothetical protein FBU30_000930 [Linnemannia zychae]|nr:hypothetical protein FBU30_000930 [Linnemannia zychae]
MAQGRPAIGNNANTTNDKKKKKLLDSYLKIIYKNKASTIRYDSLSAERRFEVAIIPFRDPDDLDVMRQVVVDADEVGDVEESNVLEDVDSDDNEEAEDNDFSDEDDSGKSGTDDNTNDATRYSRLRFKKDFSNQKYVYLACAFLARRIPELIFSPKRTDSIAGKYTLAREGKGFKRLARELRAAEPLLNKCTSAALYAMYERLIMSYEILVQLLEVQTGDTVRHTALSELFETIYSVHMEVESTKSLTAKEKAVERQRILEDKRTIDVSAVHAAMTSSTDSRTQIATRTDSNMESQLSIPSTRPNPTLPTLSNLSSFTNHHRPIAHHHQTDAAYVAMASSSTTSSAMYSMGSSHNSIVDIQQELLRAISASSKRQDEILARVEQIEERFATGIDSLAQRIMRLEESTASISSS